MIPYNNGTTVHSANLERPRTDVRITGNLAVANAELALDLNGESMVSFDLRNAFSANLLCEGSIDGVNYIILPFYSPQTESWTTVATTVGTYLTPNIAAYRKVRLRLSSYSSGSVTAVLSASIGNSMVYAKPIPTTIISTATGAAAAAVTLTIAAPASGLFHYITRLVIERHTSALLTAAATPVIVTTTNKPGSLAFSIPADAAPQGQVYREVIEMGEHALKSSAANTATTIVCPITTGVIWRVTAYYYLGA